MTDLTIIAIILMVLYKKGIIKDSHLKSLKKWLIEIFKVISSKSKQKIKTAKIVQDKTTLNKKKYSNSFSMSKIVSVFKWSFLLIILFIVIIIINPFVTIDAGHRGVVFDKLRGGVQKETWMEGLHFKIPFFQTITQIPVKTQKIVFVNKSNSQLAYNKMSRLISSTEPHQQLGSMLAASSDLQDVYVDAVITYHLSPTSVYKIYQEVGTDYEAKKVVPRAIDSVKTYTAKFKVADILTKREEIKIKVIEDLKKNLALDGIVLEDVNLTNFDFNSQFKSAIEQKQIEEQKAQKEEYILKQIEISSQQKVKRAEADKQAKVLEGEGIAEYNKLIQQEITDKVLEYKKLENTRIAINKWSGVYPQTYFGSGEDTPIPLINLGR